MQIAKEIFTNQLGSMKQVLDLAEFKMGKGTDDFKYFRKEVFDFTYRQLTKLFKTLETNKLIKKCKCNHSLRKGYSSCEFCGGSGYTNFK